MAKMFYVQLIGEESLYKHSVIIENDSITLLEFAEDIKNKEFYELISETGIENIPRGWRKVPKSRLIPTNSILSFYEDVDYQSDIDRWAKEDKELKEIRKFAIEKYNNLTNLNKFMFDIYFKIKYWWLNGKTMEDKLMNLNYDYIKNEILPKIERRNNYVG